jgi:hypothetical protein
LIITRNTDLETKFIRIVYRGRIITDYIRVHTIIPVIQENTSESPNSDESAALLDKKESNAHPFYMHCVISDAPQTSQPSEAQAIEPARGFDRLLDMGILIDI